MKKINEIKKKKICGICKKSKVLGSYYTSDNPMFDGRVGICTPCIKLGVKYDDMQTVYDLLAQMDVMFDYKTWETALASKSDTIGKYINMTNLNQFDGKRWKDSIFKEEVKNINSNSTVISNDNISIELIEKWGEGYQPEEYRSFERKFIMLKNNYQEKTAMHTEALLTYIRYRVKEELATAKNDSKAAKEWGGLASTAATAAKINPSQLSKADLSSGLDSFSTLTRSVEETVDIVSILPKFKEKPQDKVDFTLFCYVNYIRDLKGLPPAEYQDIYKFYDDRKEMYKDLDFLGIESEEE